jgi:hypothetical protein
MSSSPPPHWPSPKCVTDRGAPRDYAPEAFQGARVPSLNGSPAGWASTPNRDADDTLQTSDEQKIWLTGSSRPVHIVPSGGQEIYDDNPTEYWAEAFGGPTTCSDCHGDQTSVVQMHSGNDPYQKMDRRAIACLDLAVVDVGLGSNERLRQSAARLLRLDDPAVGSVPHKAAKRAAYGAGNDGRARTMQAIVSRGATV